jgi:hypothetical protein
MDIRASFEKSHRGIRICRLDHCKSGLLKILDYGLPLGCLLFDKQDERMLLLFG